MKVAFTFNLRRTDAEEEAEFDSAETVDAIAEAIESAGHDVDKVEVSGSASDLLEQLDSCDPDIIFNTAEGRRGRFREPALLKERDESRRGEGADREMKLHLKGSRIETVDTTLA